MTDPWARRVQGAWPGLLVGAAGWVLTGLVLVQGGGYFVVVPRLALAVPLAVVGTVTACAAAGVPAVRLNAVLWLGVVAAAGAAWNVLVFWLRLGDATWRLLLPLAHPTGIDFRDGLYAPAAAFTTAHSGWPPLTLLLGRPFTLLSVQAGYHVQVVILVALAVASVVLGAALARRVAVEAGSQEVGRPLSATPLALVTGLWLLTSYGFMYAVERGNIDLYALFFCLLGVWFMLRRSGSAWAATLALAVAVDLKLYPAVLLVLLFWRYRLRAVLPAVVCVLGLLLVAGPGNVRDFAVRLGALQGDARALWWGNHSASALANVLHGIYGWDATWTRYPLWGAPLALGAVTIVLLVRRGWSDRTAVLAAAACFPVMGVVPAISHDYKLVLCVFPLAVLTAGVATMRRDRAAWWSLLFGLLGLAMMLLARSSLVVAPSLLGSKYALLVLLQVLLLVLVWETGRAHATTGEEVGEKA